MKILVATPIFPPDDGGPATYTKEVSERLTKRGHTISVVTFSDAPREDSFSGVRVRALSRKNSFLKRNFLFFYEVFKTSPAFDLVYIHEPSIIGLAASLAAKMRRKKTLLKFVGDRAWESAFAESKTKKLLDDFLAAPDAGFRSSVIKWLEQRVFNLVDAIVVPSAYLKKVLRTHYEVVDTKIHVIYNAAEHKEGGKDAAFNEKTEPRIAVVARLVPWKGIEGVIEALSILKKDIPNATLSVAGDGPELPSLKRYAEEKGVAGDISFLGKISRTETAALRRRSAVFVLNSFYEGLPHSVLSSFAAGVPVVATGIPGTDEAVYDGKTGVAVPMKNSRALAEAIKKIMTDRSFARILTANAKVLLAERFSWEAHLGDLTALCESLVLKPSDKP